MARSARRYLLGLAPLALLLLTADACGLDAVGALEPSTRTASEDRGGDRRGREALTHAERNT
jgi:hypothetical protein